MNALLKIVCRVIARRVADGEDLEAALEDYPKLTDSEKQEIKENVRKSVR